MESIYLIGFLHHGVRNQICVGSNGFCLRKSKTENNRYLATMVVACSKQHFSTQPASFLLYHTLHQR